VWDEHIVTGVFASPFANPFKKRDQSVIHFHPDGLILRDDFGTAGNARRPGSPTVGILAG
jgi:hypothetical protein